ncbi:DUF3135 domain-containing protein [Ketobacter sp.]|uniref:DUF3135 domain-containing protein n=1 Tax=Ketobacter sp. TaxID=2083498 RepID=UPI000F1FFBDF|nr:DUF3135 domain-containing protein [Ketobacter sp.]RLT94517.1 MAG: DUF3135 domain-containing protein [Ketobacter sp.]
MSYDLPEFDKLREMAQRDPEALERLRVELCDRVIQEAPEKYRRKLRGLQFRVDMERRRAKSPMAACIAISGMMHDSFDRLRQTLNEAAGNATPGYLNTPSREVEEGKVLPFRRA